MNGQVRADYQSKVRAAFAAQPAGPAPVVTADQLAPLPAAIRGYLAFTGALDKPRPRNMRLAFQAEMWRKPGGSPMDVRTEQYNFFDRPTRLFFLDTSMFALPVAGLHAYGDGNASMLIRAASLFDVVNASGPELAAAETVTALNDLTLYAPGALLDPRIHFEELDERRVRVTFAPGDHRVSAELHFGDQGELVSFVSDDRGALQDDGSFEKQRWSTPVSDYRDVDGRRVPTYGEAIYHTASGDFVYGRFRVTSVAWDLPGFLSE